MSKYYANKQSQDKSSHISNFHTESSSDAANSSASNLHYPVQYPNLSCLHGKTKSHCMFGYLRLVKCNRSHNIRLMVCLIYRI